MSVATWVMVGFLGGGAGTARFLIDATIASRSDHPFPLGILAVNLGGAFALGLVAGAALSGEALIVVAGGIGSSVEAVARHDRALALPPAQLAPPLVDIHYPQCFLNLY